MNFIGFNSDQIFQTNEQQKNKCTAEQAYLDMLLVSGEGTTVEVAKQNNAALAEAINNTFRLVDAAGGVVVMQGKILSIIRNGISDLPKGHVEAGETFEQAALREVEEETGQCDLHIESFIDYSWHCYRLNNQWCLKRTAWYLMSTTAPFKNKPQTEESITEIKMIDADAMKNFADTTFRSIREILYHHILGFISKK